MVGRRIVVCLDVDRGRVVKGLRFRGLRDVGDPAALAAHYEAEGADEIVFLDISASVDGRATLLEAVRRTAERLFIPLTVGGGIGSVDDADRALRAGADKVAINTAAVRRPALLTEAGARFGAQCVVASIDADRDTTTPSGYRVFVRGGRSPTQLDAVEWAARCAELGAGEILLTAIHRDGVRSGFDLDLTRRVAGAVDVPVIASGGAGRPADFVSVLGDGRADAALAAGIFHDGVVSIDAVKASLAGAALPVRWTAPKRAEHTGAPPAFRSDQGAAP